MNWCSAIAAAAFIVPFAVPTEAQVLSVLDKAAIGHGFEIANMAACNLPTELSEALFDWSMTRPEISEYEKARLIGIMHESREKWGRRFLTEYSSVC